MEILRKVIFFTSLVVFSFLSNNAVKAENPVSIHLFHLETCPHCQTENAFLDSLQKKDPNLSIHRYELQSTKNQMLLSNLAGKYGIKTDGVPITIINDQIVYGFDSDATTGKEIETAVAKCRKNACPDIVEQGIDSGEKNKIPATNNRYFIISAGAAIAVIVVSVLWIMKRKKKKNI